MSEEKDRAVAGAFMAGASMADMSSDPHCRCGREMVNRRFSGLWFCVSQGLIGESQAIEIARLAAPITPHKWQCPRRHWWNFWRHREERSCSDDAPPATQGATKLAGDATTDGPDEARWLSPLADSGAGSGEQSRPASEVAKDIAKDIFIASDLRGATAMIERDRQEVRAAALEEAAREAGTWPQSGPTWSGAQADNTARRIRALGVADVTMATDHQRQVVANDLATKAVDNAAKKVRPHTSRR